jgi:hypothetical protein
VISLPYSTTWLQTSAAKALDRTTVAIYVFPVRPLQLAVELNSSAACFLIFDIVLADR